MTYIGCIIDGEYGRNHFCKEEDVNIVRIEIYPIIRNFLSWPCNKINLYKYDLVEIIQQEHYETIRELRVRRFKRR